MRHRHKPLAVSNSKDRVDKSGIGQGPLQETHRKARTQVVVVVHYIYSIFIIDKHCIYQMLCVTLRFGIIQLDNVAINIQYV